MVLILGRMLSRVAERIPSVDKKRNVKTRLTGITHDVVVDRAAKWLKSIGCGAVLSELRTHTRSGEQPDAIGWRDGVSILVECKTSRSDFFRDAKKRFRIQPELGMGDWRFYMCPDGVLTPEDMPEGWGLLSIKSKRVLRAHGFPANTMWSHKPFEGEKTNEAIMLVSALRRYQTRAGELRGLTE